MIAGADTVGPPFCCRMQFVLRMRMTIGADSIGAAKLGQVFDPAQENCCRSVTFAIEIHATRIMERLP